MGTVLAIFAWNCYAVFGRISDSGQLKLEIHKIFQFSPTTDDRFTICISGR